MQPVDAEVTFMFQDTEENVILMTKILLRGKALVRNYLFDPICPCSQSNVPAVNLVGIRFLPPGLVVFQNMG